MDIAWICETYEHEGKTERRLVRSGMSREDIIANFPPNKGSTLAFNRAALIKAIMMEAYNETTPHSRGNIRSFWYERLMWTLINVMGEPGNDDNIASINVSISGAWMDLVEEGITDIYEVLNLYSEKERGYRISVKSDSPYPRAVVLVEKESLYDELAPIADTYEISLVAAGGQNSQAAALAYVAELKNKGIDTLEDFWVFSYTDADPEGYAIPLGFVKHLENAVEGNISLIRMGVLPNQLGESVIAFGAIPYPMKGKDTRSAKIRDQIKKSKSTKYARFVAETGGIFIDGNIPARVELNIYTPQQLFERIVDALSQHLHVFPYQTRVLSEAIRDEYDEAENSVKESIAETVTEVYQPYYDAIDAKEQALDEEAEKREPEKRKKLEELQAEMDALELEIEEACSDLTAQGEKLKSLRERLEKDAEEATEKAQSEWRDYPDADELVNEITDWREWMDDQGIDELEDSDLANDARKRQEFSYELDDDEREWVRDWISEEIDTSSVDIRIDQSPDEVISEALS